MLGKIHFTLCRDDRIEVCIPAAGADYVYARVPNPPFLESVIELFKNNYHLTIEKVCECFGNFKDRIEIYNPGAFPTGVSPEKFIEGNERPVRRNPLITRTLYYSKDMESFATGLKRIYTACKAAGCRVEFEQQAYGFAVIFYRRNTSTQGSPQDSTQDKHQDNTQDSLQNRILEYCKVPRSKKEITVYMGYKDVKSFAKRYLKPLCEAGELQMTIPDRPSSRNQKYVTVEKKEENNVWTILCG